VQSSPISPPRPRIHRRHPRRHPGLRTPLPGAHCYFCPAPRLTRARPRRRVSADFSRKIRMRIIASRVGRSRARPPIGASALGVAAARERAATRHDRPRRYGPPTKEPRGRNARAAEPLFLFFSFLFFFPFLLFFVFFFRRLHTEGIINICYSAYGARAAPFHPTIRPTGRTLNTLSPSLYVQVARHTRSGIVESPRSRSSVKENLYLLSAARFVCLSLSHSHPLSLSSRPREHRWRSSDLSSPWRESNFGTNQPRARERGKPRLFSRRF
jgi:hypothetical protein